MEQLTGVGGTRIAFLAYNSILPHGYWAEQNAPGCAPIRGVTVYQPIEYDQPGTPCRILTFTNPQDLKAMEDDIMINQNAEPSVVTREDKSFGEVLGYMERISEDQKLNVKLVAEGDEVTIKG